jgi:hypothetical protein
MRLLPGILIALGAVLGAPEGVSGQLESCGPAGCCPPGQYNTIRPALPWRRPLQVTAVRHPAVCRVTVGPPVDLSCGSGVLIDRDDRRGLVLTASHVVDAEPVIVALGGKRYAAKVLQRSAADDLALLQIARPEVEPVILADSPPAPRGEIRILGFGPRGYRRFIGRARGYVRSGTQAGVWTLCTTGQCVSGCSGGPMLDAQGRLVGITWGSKEGCSYGTACTRIRWWLRKWLPTWPPGQGRVQRPSSDRPADLTQPPPAPPVEPSKPSSERPANVQQIAVLVKRCRIIAMSYRH